MELSINYRGVELHLNEWLVERQKCWDKVPEILDLHKRRICLEELMELGMDMTDLWIANQLQLQEAWGFPRDINHHKFWTVPGCKCPKLDNEDRYPTGQYVITGSCPWHGA